MISERRLDWIDSAKGIGIVLVVLGHTIVPDIYHTSTTAKFIREFIYNFHMPLFFFFSGYLFEYGIERYTDKKRFIISKARKLLIPYLFFSAFAYLFVAVALSISKLAVILKDGGYNSKSLSKTIFEILTHQGHIDKHLWFVYALFFIFLINILLIRTMKNPAMLFVMFLLSILGPSLNHYVILSSIAKYMFYFCLARFYLNSEMIRKIYMRINSISLLTIFLVMNLGCTVCKLQLDLENTVIKLSLRLWTQLIAVLGIAIVCRLANLIKDSGKTGKVLSIFGNHSFDIYLMHAPFLVSGLVGILLRYSPMPKFIICLIAFVCGLLLPVLTTDLIVRRVPWLNTIVLGEKLKRKSDQ